MCGTRIARIICDGAPRQGTFANSSDAAIEPLCWALVAQKNLMAYGADCSNAFAEAPPPTHLLYMKIDEAYRDWWENHLKKLPIPPTCTVVKVAECN